MDITRSELVKKLHTCKDERELREACGKYGLVINGVKDFYSNSFSPNFDSFPPSYSDRTILKPISEYEVQRRLITGELCWTEKIVIR